MNLSNAAKLCSDLLVELDHIRFDLHDIQIAVATKELKSAEAKDLEFGLDYLNGLMSDAQRITKKMETLRTELDSVVKPGREKKEGKKEGKKEEKK